MTAEAIVYVRVIEEPDELLAIEELVLNKSGTPRPGRVIEGVTEYVVPADELFSLRTRARDLRDVPQGVTAAFADIRYATQGDATQELAMLQWGEMQRMSFSERPASGSFRLAYGSTATSPIEISGELTSNDLVQSHSRGNRFTRAVRWNAELSSSLRGSRFRRPTTGHYRDSVRWFKR